jgi:hypothetical protein
MTLIVADRSAFIRLTRAIREEGFCQPFGCGSAALGSLWWKEHHALASPGLARSAILCSTPTRVSFDGPRPMKAFPALRQQSSQADGPAYSRATPAGSRPRLSELNLSLDHEAESMQLNHYLPRRLRRHWVNNVGACLQAISSLQSRVNSLLQLHASGCV